MESNLKKIGYMGGIPFMVENEADEKALAPMFPNGGEFNSAVAKGISSDNSASEVNKRENFIEKSQRISDEMMRNNPFGENSIFYRPVPKLIDHSIKE